MPAIEFSPNGADLTEKTGWDHGPSRSARATGATIEGGFTTKLGAAAPVWAGIDGPSPSPATQTRAGVPWGGSDRENGLGPSVPVREGHRREHKRARITALLVATGVIQEIEVEGRLS